MRRYLAAAALLLLTACGNDRGDSALSLGIEQIGKIGSDALEGPTAAQIRSRLTPAVMDRRPGHVIIASLPKRNVAAALFQTAQNDGVVTYLTPDGNSLALRGVVLVGTRGLGFDLMSADVAGPLAALAGGAQTGVARIHHYLDGENSVIKQRFICSYTRAGGTILESCTAPGSSISNSYTFGGDGRIAASRQWISPEIGYVQIDHVR